MAFHAIVLPMQGWVIPSHRLRDGKETGMQAALHKAFMTPFEAVVERAKAKHGISPPRTTSDLISALVGPLFYRRWFSKQKIDKRFIEGIIALVLR